MLGVCLIETRWYHESRPFSSLTGKVFLYAKFLSYHPHVRAQRAHVGGKKEILQAQQYQKVNK